MGGLVDKKLIFSKLIVFLASFYEEKRRFVTGFFAEKTH